MRDEKGATGFRVIWGGSQIDWFPDESKVDSMFPGL